MNSLTDSLTTHWVCDSQKFKTCGKIFGACKSFQITKGFLASQNPNRACVADSNYLIGYVQVAQLEQLKGFLWGAHAIGYLK
jgi:hypothetical protein